jgi:hypothetical protein
MRVRNLRRRVHRCGRRDLSGWYQHCGGTKQPQHVGHNFVNSFYSNRTFDS